MSADGFDFTEAINDFRVIYDALKVNRNNCNVTVDFSVLNNIVNIPFHNTMGLHCLIYMVGNGGVLRVSQVLDTEEFFRLLDTAGGE